MKPELLLDQCIISYEVDFCLEKNHTKSVKYHKIVCNRTEL